jgi:hypothetical protein
VPTPSSIASLELAFNIPVQTCAGRRNRVAARGLVLRAGMAGCAITGAQVEFHPRLP